MDYSKFITSKDNKSVNVMGCIQDILDDNLIFINNKGYINKNDESVWIYSGNGKPKNCNQYPYFWFENNNDMVFSEPSKEVLEEFHKDKIVDYSTNEIINKTKSDEVLYNEQEINDINSASTVFVPKLNDTDDPLKKCIKYSIIEKSTDINRFKYKTTADYMIPNMKSALVNPTKMSITNFVKWCEYLGLNFLFIIYNNGSDPVDPLPNSLLYDSQIDSIKSISKEDFEEIKRKICNDDK